MRIFSISYVLALGLIYLISFQLLAQPLIIAHRGASGYLPEHTLEAAALAYAHGADYIEQDLVLSKDAIPVVLHDIHLETVTNVEHLFPKRNREDGRYYVIDFTLTELKTLTVHERQDKDGAQVFPKRYQGSGHFQIATFEEHIELISQLNRQLNKDIGIYPEIKSPAWHKREGADISQIVLTILRKHGLDDANKKVFIQCFDFAETKRLRKALGAKAKLVQLIGENAWQESATDYEFLKTRQGMQEIAKVANGIGPWIPQLLDLKTLKATGLIESAHATGLLVHPYTHRADALPNGVSNQQALSLLFTSLKVDGLFTDFTDTVVTFRAQMQP